MQTQRLINQTWLVFVGTLLGSVFGLMGTVAAIMKFTEIFSEKYERKKLKKLSLEEKIDKRLLLNFEGNLNISRKSSARIAPTVYEISENS